MCPSPSNKMNIFGKKPILSRPRPEPVKKGDKPVANLRVGNVNTPQGQRGRIEAISPSKKALNLPGRKTPKGQPIAKGDFDNRTESTINKTLQPAVRQVMKKVVKARHNVRFPDQEDIHDPSPYYPEEEEK